MNKKANVDDKTISPFTLLDNHLKDIHRKIYDIEREIVFLTRRYDDLILLIHDAKKECESNIKTINKEDITDILVTQKTFNQFKDTTEKRINHIYERLNLFNMSGEKLI